MAELAERSAVIFEAVVVDVHARKNAHGGIVTAVVFDVLEVIKGNVPQRRLTLEFLGGHLQRERHVVAAMNYPRLGEKGIYFAEAIDRALVNPLYGWDQGRFLLERDDGGIERVLTATRQAVVEVQAGDSLLPGAASAQRLSNGVAGGVRVQPATVGTQPLSTGQFKQRIRNLLGTAP